MKQLSDFHNCEKCEGKIVCITIDKLGVTRCVYCNKIVDYSDYFRYKEAERQLKKLKGDKNETKQ